MAPHGRSVNEGISKEDHSLQYVTVDDNIKHVIQLGKGALMFKVDIKHAFRLIPVHRDDWLILGMVWKDKYYVEKVLPFGLRSSPALFNYLAEAVCWILRHNYNLEYYLDDFMGVAPRAQPWLHPLPPFRRLQPCRSSAILESPWQPAKIKLLAQQQS